MRLSRRPDTQTRRVLSPSHSTAPRISQATPTTTICARSSLGALYPQTLHPITRATARTARPRKHNTARGRSPQRVLRRLQTQHRPQHSDESLSPRPCPVESIGDTWRDAHFLQGASRCAPLAHNRSLQAVRTLSLTMSSIMSSTMSNPDGSCSRALPIIPSAWAVAPISELIPPSSLTTPTPVESTSVAMGLRRATPPHCRVM